MFLKLTKIQRAGALLALLFSVQATSANLSQTQSCVLKGVLTGDSRHFWFWGRDSWVGKVDIICEPESPRRTVRPPENPKNDRKIERYEVILRFSPWSPGIGASQDHQIEISSERFERHRVDKLFGTFRTFTSSLNSFLGNLAQIRVEMNRQEFYINLRSPFSLGLSNSEMESILGTGQISIEAIGDKSLL